MNMEVGSMESEKRTLINLENEIHSKVFTSIIKRDFLRAKEKGRIDEIPKGLDVLMDESDDVYITAAKLFASSYSRIPHGSVYFSFFNDDESSKLYISVKKTNMIEIGDESVFEFFPDGSLIMNYHKPSVLLANNKGNNIVELLQFMPYINDGRLSYEPWRNINLKNEIRITIDLFYNKYKPVVFSDPMDHCKSYDRRIVFNLFNLKKENGFYVSNPELADVCIKYLELENWK